MKRPPHDSHSNRLAELCDFAPDRPGPDQAQSLPAKLCDHGARPLAAAHSFIDFNRAFRNSHHQRESVFGHCNRRHSGRIRNSDSMAFRCGEVDIVGSGAPDRNQAQVWALPEYLRGESRCRAEC
jgi:hypothetical protein